MDIAHRQGRRGFACIALVVALAGGVEAQQAAAPGITAGATFQTRSYVFPQTNESIPYALFVPTTYNGTKRWPLIVGLHGGGVPFDGVMRFEGMTDLAERGGFIVVTPLGYHPVGGYGSLAVLDDPSRPRSATVRAETLQRLVDTRKILPPNIDTLSEQDVMNVMGLVRKEFNIDADRIYLFGHSMGGGGALFLGHKYPDLWAALAVAAPAPVPTQSQLERMKKLPVLILQGGDDVVVMPQGTRAAVGTMASLGMQHLYVEIQGGDHIDFITKNQETLSRVFAFFTAVGARPQ